MRVFSLLIVISLISVTSISAQKYFTRNGKISFYSDAPLEKIEALNNQATSVIDATTGKMEFAILIKAFQFEKALMQEHFNENYMESSQFPKATFKGAIKDPEKVNFGEDGEYEVVVTGDMTIHGVTKPIEAPGLLKVDGEKITATSEFELTVADFDIKIPAVVRDNIAKTVKVSVELDYQPLKKGS
jgi:polyisoprenoid-binding protein YceI